MEVKMRQSPDITGQKFGRLTIIGPCLRGKQKQWCKCECGNETKASYSDLHRGAIKSCGCLRSEINSLVGKKFDRLTVVSWCGFNKFNHPIWECICICGNKIITSGNRLLCGKTRSCGCLKKELDLARLPKNKLSKGEAHRNVLYNQYKKNAEKRLLGFCLTIEQFELTTKKPCHYCGVASSERTTKLLTNGAYIGNGIDRIDNNVGYIESNCVPCCKQCNWAKRNMKHDDFINWIHRASNHLVQQTKELS